MEIISNSDLVDTTKTKVLRSIKGVTLTDQIRDDVQIEDGERFGSIR